MDPDEFDAYLETLSPMERQKALYDFGFQKMNYVPPGFQGAYSPELTQQEYDLGQYTMAPPSLDDGQIEPYSLDIAKDIGNWQQDIFDMTADPVAAMIGGAGAYSPQAFEPVVTPVGEPLDQPNRRYVETMANTGPGYQSFLAQKILDGMNPGQAIAEMWRQINSAPEAPQTAEEQAAKTQADAIKASLPPAQVDTSNPATMAPSAQQQQPFDFTTPVGQATSSNVDAITTTANDLFYKMTADQPIGYTDPKTGLGYAGSTEEPSELAQHFAELGFATPFEKYTDPQWLGASVPEEYRQQKAATLDAAQGRITEAKTVEQQVRDNMRMLETGFRESAPERAAAMRPVEPTGPADNPYNLTPGSMQAARTAADLDWQGLQESGQGAPQLEDYVDEARRQLGLGPAGQQSAQTWQAMTTGQGLGSDAMQQQIQNRAQDLYEQAQTGYEKMSQSAALGEAMRRGAEASRPNANPYVLTSGNDILNTYDFGGYNQQEQGALGQMLGIIAQAKGNQDVGFTPYNQDYIQNYGSAIRSAVDQRDEAQRYYDQAYQYQSPEEHNWASAMGRAMAMSDMGRTPMEDQLMQRALGRASMNPYSALGY